ncbi:MAG: hypothetical protein LBU37_05010 [Tannerellaceae bacterium]|jgi:hypothetical protein|nr:hypothetical protein [Tannerellaceae bacterium]
MKVKLPLHLLLINLLLSVSCSVSRKATADRTFRQADSVAREMRDSLALSRRLQASFGQSAQVRHVMFSPPDSAGRQYVASVTLLSAVTGGAYAEQSSGERKQTANQTEMHAEQSVEHTGSGSRAGRFPYWMAAAGIGIIGSLYAILARGRRKA